MTYFLRSFRAYLISWNTQAEIDCVRTENREKVRRIFDSLTDPGFELVSAGRALRVSPGLNSHALRRLPDLRDNRAVLAGVRNEYH